MRFEGIRIQPYGCFQVLGRLIGLAELGQRQAEVEARLPIRGVQFDSVFKRFDSAPCQAPFRVGTSQGVVEARRRRCL